MFCLAYMLHSSTVRELIIKNNSPAASAHSTKSDDAIHILAISLNFAPLVLFLYDFIHTFQLFPIGKESVTFPCDSNVLLPAVN